MLSDIFSAKAKEFSAGLAQLDRDLRLKLGEVIFDKGAIIGGPMSWEELICEIQELKKRNRDRRLPPQVPETSKAERARQSICELLQIPPGAHTWSSVVARLKAHIAQLEDLLETSNEVSIADLKVRVRLTDMLTCEKFLVPLSWEQIHARIQELRQANTGIGYIRPCATCGCLIVGPATRCKKCPPPGRPGPPDCGSEL